MNDSENEKYRLEIKRLKRELEDKSRDLDVYKSEVTMLNEKITDLVQNIEKQINIASKIHGLLVPSELPEIQGFGFSTKYVASGISGGDYFDIFRLNNKSRFSLLMASSSGHAMAALFLSVLIRLTSQMIGKSKNSASEIMSKITEELKGSIEGENSASLLMAVVDRKDFTLDMSVRGEMYAWLQNSPESSAKRLEIESEPITSETLGDPTSVKLHLNSGNRLILTTHGLVNLVDATGEIFGVDRVEKVIECGRGKEIHELRNELLFQAEQFVGGKEFTRDLTIIVMDVRHSVLKLAPE